jgi:hypothetical protein
MSGFDLSDASTYNRRRDGSLWSTKDLPWPFSDEDPDSTCFARLVAIFQLDHGLTVDGKLGPNTLSALRAETLDWPDHPDGSIEPDAPDVPSRTGTSNAIVVAGEQTALPSHLVDAGLTATNFATDDIHRFEARSRSAEVEHLVLHESVTRDVASTVRVLDRKGYGVHLMVAPDGHITCHNDLVADQPIHANQLNSSSIGLEVVNPYSPKWARPPFNRFIDAKWWTWVPDDAPHQYVLPTGAQQDALEFLVPWVCSLVESLPLSFPTADLDWRQRKITGWRDGAEPAPGVVAHRDFSSHADGRWPLEELIRRADDLQV